MNMLTINGPRLGFRLRGDVNRFFEDFVERALPGAACAERFPALNILEDGEHFYAEAEVPGLAMDDIEVTVEGNELTIKGERKETTEEGVSFHRRERAVGAFARTITLPVEIDVEAVSAGLKHGVLTVTLPKSAAARPRKIAVNCEDA